MRPSPGSADLAFDEERAWPHAGRPEPLPLILARNEKLPLCSVEQEVGIAARQQACGRGDRLGGVNRRLVFREQPLVAERRSDRQQRSLERRECVSRRPAGDPCPAGEPANRRGSENVEVASSELATGVGRIDLRSDDRPNRRRTRAFPADGDRARRRGVPDRVAVRARPRGPSSACRRGGRATAQPCARPEAGSWRCREASRARTARSRASRRHRCWYRGPHSWASDGSSHVDGSTPSTRACNESSAALGMLSCRPAHAARRSDSEPVGMRSSSAPTRRRNARICLPRDPESRFRRTRHRARRTLVPRGHFAWAGVRELRSRVPVTRLRTPVALIRSASRQARLARSESTIVRAGARIAYERGRYQRRSRGGKLRQS